MILVRIGMLVWGCLLDGELGVRSPIEMFKGEPDGRFEIYDFKPYFRTDPKTTKEIYNESSV